MRTSLKKFPDENVLAQLIESYFATLGNKQRARISHKKTLGATNIKQSAPVKTSQQQPTITGLALYLGFNSRSEFEEYENRGKFARLIKRACLQIEAVYENKLLQPSPNGAIFALKSRGWNEKPENKSDSNRSNTFKVKIQESGPNPASSEKEVAV